MDHACAVVVRAFAGVPGVEVSANGNDLIWELTSFDFSHDVVRIGIWEIAAIHLEVKLNFPFLKCRRKRIGRIGRQRRRRDFLHAHIVVHRACVRMRVLGQA